MFGKVTDIHPCRCVVKCHCTKIFKVITGAEKTPGLCAQHVDCWIILRNSRGRTLPPRKHSVRSPVFNSVSQTNMATLISLSPLSSLLFRFHELLHHIELFIQRERTHSSSASLQQRLDFGSLQTARAERSGGGVRCQATGRRAGGEGRLCSELHVMLSKQQC